MKWREKQKDGGSGIEGEIDRQVELILFFIGIK